MRRAQGFFERAGKQMKIDRYDKPARGNAQGEVEMRQRQTSNSGGDQQYPVGSGDETEYSRLYVQISLFNLSPYGVDVSETPALFDRKPDVAKAGGNPHTQSDQRDPGGGIEAPVEIDACEQADENRQGNLKPEATVIRKVFPSPSGLSFHAQNILKNTPSRGTVGSSQEHLT